MPLIRDETGTAIVGAAHWWPPDDAQLLHGEAVVDDAVLFDLLSQWAPDAAARQRVLVDNPQTLYGFAKSA